MYRGVFLLLFSDRFIIKERGYMGDSGRGSERYIEIHYLIFKTMELLPCLMKNVMKCIKKLFPILVSSSPVEEN